MKTVLVVCLLVAASCARKGFGPGEQDWGYVEVRSGAYEFWWLYETTAQVETITEKPLVIWLQGGPGASSTGYGNFAEIGPLDEDLNTRKHTWVKDVNVLFIDNPVGTGYSYVDKQKYLTTTNKEIADDLVKCIEGFYAKRPEFRNVPLYITSESYGGKMAAEFGLELYRKGFKNVKGVNMIDAWISPIDSVLHWAPFLLNVGAIDQQGYNKVDAGAKRTQQLLEEGKFSEATDQWRITEYIIMGVAHRVDFYNILKKIGTNCRQAVIARTLLAKPGAPECGDVEMRKITALMNGQIKEALNLTVTWGEQSGAVFTVLSEDFMKPVVDIVAQLLDETDLKVQVVTGQLDLIVDTPGTIAWIDNMEWSRKNEWPRVSRTELSVNGVNEGYQKKLGQFEVYWVNRAGHMVPADNPTAMDSILKNLLN